MMIKKTVLTGVFAAAFLTVGSMSAPAAMSVDQLPDLVDETLELIRTQGKDAAAAHAKERFGADEADRDGHCWGMNTSGDVQFNTMLPDLEGFNLMNFPDAQGNLWLQQMMGELDGGAEAGSIDIWTPSVSTGEIVIYRAMWKKLGWEDLRFVACSLIVEE